MPKVLVLGASGMLGSMVYNYLSADSQLEVRGTLRKEEPPFYFLDAENFKAEDLAKILNDCNPDYIINCIGIIKPYCKDDDSVGCLRAIKVNTLFPYLLAEAAKGKKIKIIQIATDCVYSGRQGEYTENTPHDALDVYGKSKSLGEVQADNFLHLRCSIIGPEKKNKLSLLEWFLSQPAGAELKGFTHHRWNGVTTLQFAKICAEIINQGEDYFAELLKISAVHHFVPNTTVNKNELLHIFAEVFAKSVRIMAVDNISQPVDRTLATNFKLLLKESTTKPLKVALQELKNYIEKHNFYF
ncbi:MAG: sugar nucleotide-binding protein [Patescibacteria group bacterium]|jgi:dTDP-4-dehydrorhamnose reductase